MAVREWDPANAPEGEIEAWRCVLNAALAADVPTEPEWLPDHIREYLTVTLPDEGRAAWVAEEAGEPIGFANLVLLGGDNADACVLEMFVRPDARRGGVGRDLLTAVADHAIAHGRDLLTVEVIGGTPTGGFYESLGFQLAVVEERNILDLATVDWPRIEELAGQLGSGYHTEYLPDGPPEGMLAAYAEAKTLLNEPTVPASLAADAPPRPDSVIQAEVARLRASLATLHARGMRPYVVVAVQTNTGAIAGLTELVVPLHHPYRADQYDTVVVAPHRGYGLGLAMKARMLLGLRADEPHLSTVQTWHSTDNEPMLRVNSVLGFTPERETYEYEIDLPELVKRLHPDT